MSDPDLRPEAVREAAQWLRTNGALYTPEVLTANLRDAGYTDAEIAAARVEAATAPPPVAQDLRAKAAAILIVAFLGVWVVFAFLLMRNDEAGYGSLSAIILAAVLGTVGLISLAAIAANGRLRRGAEGALAAVLAIPFVVLVIVAGLCVLTTGNVMTQ